MSRRPTRKHRRTWSDEADSTFATAVTIVVLFALIGGLGYFFPLTPQATATAQKNGR